MRLLKAIDSKEIKGDFHLELTESEANELLQTIKVLLKNTDAHYHVPSSDFSKELTIFLRKKVVDI